MSGERKNAFEVKWHIKNIRPWLQSKDDYLSSPPFLAKTIMDTRWKLKLSRKWRLDENYISLVLQRDTDGYPEHIALNIELSFLTYDGLPLKSKSCKSKFAQKTTSQELQVMGVEILGEKKEAYLPEDVLTVSCKLWKDLSSISKGGQCSIVSVVGRKCVTLDGTIDYFSTLANSNVTLNFMSPSEDIFISFNVEIGKPSHYLKFERTELESKCFRWYSCDLFILDAAGKRDKFAESYNLATLLNPQKPCSFYPSYRYQNLQNSELLKNDVLTFLIDVTYFPGVESEHIVYDYKNFDKLITESAGLENESISNSKDVNASALNSLNLTETENKACDIRENETNEEDCDTEKRHLPSTGLKEYLTSLYEDRLFCDTKLRTDTETFPAHRCVLSVRSPVFKKMFTTDMKEKAGECINVPDISSDTIRRMLQFLYTDCTGDLDMQSAKDLYIAADKYHIASLKERCSSFMKENLCPSNVCDVLVLADMHRDKDLESAAQEYVLSNDEEVFYSDEWKLFMENYNGLAAQVMYLKITKK